GGCADEIRNLLPNPHAQLEHALEPRLAAAPLLLVVAGPLLHRLQRRACERPERPRVEVRVAIEHRKERPRFRVCHSTSRSTGAWSESTRPPRIRRSTGQTCGGPAARPRARMWSMPVGVAPEKPHSAVMRSGRVRELRRVRLKSPHSRTGSP